MKIMIDPGHGGDDNGAAYGYAEEDDINLSIGYLLRCLLQQEGYEVYMTRERDIYVPLAKRCDYANHIGVDLFISLHCDAWHDETTKGISTHIYTNANADTEKIADKIHSVLIEKFPTHTNRGLKRSNFYVLRNTKMPALLVECEFISNYDMRKWLHEPENQYDIATAIVEGVKNV